ncbi:MAG: acyl-CoA dehydrogenase family protein [Acidimicrobiales bacterium]
MTNLGRDDLIEWKATKPNNFYLAVPNLATELEVRMGSRFNDSLATKLSSFGEVVAREIEPAVEAAERNREFPKLRSFDEFGRRVERVEFHPAHDDAARAAWASGMLATKLDYGGAYDLAGLFFLLSHVGEGGQACPIVCTIGLRRALEHRGSESLKAQYLAGLMETDSSAALRGSQFLTELQGGSDVGANATLASPDPTIVGAWRIIGEKWFCSVADADVFALTARPDSAPSGTKGLACFLVPRTTDGITPNGFRIRRLKDKLGTRGLASGEIDFDGALAYPIGELDEGFAIAVSDLLNTSRWLNALGSTGIMSRAYIEASSFAHHRRAFGSPIETLGAIREQLATMKIEVAASLSSTIALTELVAKIDEGIATNADRKFHRFLVNANKYVTSISATAVVHQAIEILGGNGTIEDFSPLPRLYRDSIVFESWEGTHNVLCDQVRRDCARLGLMDVVVGWIQQELKQLPESLSLDVNLVRGALEKLTPKLKRSCDDSRISDFRRQLMIVVRIIQATCLLRSVGAPISSAFIRLNLVRDSISNDPGWLSFVDNVLD